jgi:glycine cleavage system T protein
MLDSKMAELHKKLGATLIQIDGTSIPEKYSTIEEEYSAARHYAAFFDISHFGKLRITGKDAVDLLNRISTNDLSGMRPGMGKQTFLTTEKGRVVDLCTAYMQQESLLLRTSPSNSQNVKKWIEKFVISEDIKVEDVTATFPMFLVAGPSSADFLKQIAHSSHRTLLDLSKMPFDNFIRTFLGSCEVFLSRTKIAFDEGFILLVNQSDVEIVWNLFLNRSKDLGAVPAGIETFETLRVETGIPLYPSELNEDVNPLEVNNLEAVSFSKGCYVGQEVIARLQTYNKVRKRLVGLVAASKVHAGSKVFEARQPSSGAETEIGLITSSVKSPGLGKEIALAYISMQQVVPGTKYLVKVGGKNVEAELSSLPFLV